MGGAGALPAPPPPFPNPPLCQIRELRATLDTLLDARLADPGGDGGWGTCPAADAMHRLLETDGF